MVYVKLLHNVKPKYPKHTTEPNLRNDFICCTCCTVAYALSGKRNFRAPCVCEARVPAMMTKIRKTIAIVFLKYYSNNLIVNYWIVEITTQYIFQVINFIHFGDIAIRELNKVLTVRFSHTFQFIFLLNCIRVWWALKINNVSSLTTYLEVHTLL